MLHNLLNFLQSSKYFLLFIGTLIEGPIVMISSGLLYRLGQFSFFPMYLGLVLGDFVADMGWYGIGYYGARPLIVKYGKFINVTPEIINKIEGRFKQHQHKILIVSKLTMGFGFALATLIVAGMLRVSFKKYVILNLLGGFVWTIMLIGVGFFFGNVYLLISQPFKIAFLGLVGVLIIASLAIANGYLKKLEL